MPYGNTNIKLKKPVGFESLFGDESAAPTENKTAEEETPTVLSVDKLVPYKKHPFKLYEGDRLNDLAESIRANGIICPVIVRKADNDEFEILSGHNRVNAAKLAGLNEVPVIVKENIDDDEAELIMTETNLYQRGFLEMSISERARALAAHMDAMRSQGKRNDMIDEVENIMKSFNNGENLLRPMGERIDTLKDGGEKYGLGRTNVSYYLRIAKLENEVLDLLDDGRIGMTAGVELSYVGPEAQTYIAERLNSVEGYKLDIKKAEKIREVYAQGKLNDAVIEMILNGTYQKASSKKLAGTKTKNINLGFAQKYFAPTQSKKEIENTVIKALEFYMEHRAEFEDEEADDFEEEEEEWE